MASKASKDNPVSDRIRQYQKSMASSVTDGSSVYSGETGYTEDTGTEYTGTEYTGSTYSSKISAPTGMNTFPRLYDNRFGYVTTE